MDTSHQHQQVLRDYVKYCGMNQSNGECQGDPHTGANCFFFFLIPPSNKSHNTLGKYHTMQHFAPQNGHMSIWSL